MTLILRVLFVVLLVTWCKCYDPMDSDIKNILPTEGQFEAFYPREAHGVPNGASRPSHGHATFYKYRNPALVDTRNAPAYGYRFDGVRRFEFD